MSEIFSFLSHNPAYAAGAGLLLVVGAFSLLKKLIKTAIVVGILFGAYCYYLHTEGKALPTTADAERVLQQGKQMTSKLEQEAEQAQKEAQQAKQKLDEAKAKLGGK
jgi:ribosomal protein L9